MNRSIISSQQLSFLVLLLLLGNSLIYVPEFNAGRDAWAASLIASLAGWYILLLIISMQNRYPGLSMVKLAELSLGKITGTIFNLIFFSTLILVLIILIFDFVIFLRVIYSPLQPFVLDSILVLTAAYCLYRGITAISRLGELFVWITLFFLILSVITTIPNMNLTRLTPVLASWKPLLAGAFYGADRPFSQVIILAFFLPLVNDFKEKQKYIFIWYLAGVGLLVLKNFQVLSVLGAEKTDILRFPLYEVFRLISFANFQRVELFFFVLWFIIGFTSVVIYYQGLVLGLKEMFRLKDYRVLILPLGALLVVLDTYLFPTDIVFLSSAAKYYPFFTLPVFIFYVTIVWLVSTLRHKTVIRQEVKKSE
jgi:spore germination protein KB